MSLVNVNCVNCNAFFEIPKEYASLGKLGFGHGGTVIGSGKVKISVDFKAAPEFGELCPRCAYAAMRYFIHENEKNLSSFMKGEHLTKGAT